MQVEYLSYVESDHVYSQYGGTEVLRKVELPFPVPKPDEILVKVR